MKYLLLATMLTFTLALTATADAKKLKVYIMAGQSNMQGHAKIFTLEHVGMDPETKPLYDVMTTPGGDPVVSDQVFISYFNHGDVHKEGMLTVGYGAKEDRFGPELSFGLTLAQRMDNPILIIKTAWGGQSLHTDFRPPGAGPYVPSEAEQKRFKDKPEEYEQWLAEKQQATGVRYRWMVDYVNKVIEHIHKVHGYNKADGYEIAGFVWFQGWNDLVARDVYPQRHQPGGYDAYTHVLTHFIRDVRKDFNAPDMPFVIGVLGVNGDIASREPNRYTPIHLNFRKAMAAPAELPQFKGNVIAVETYKYWDQKLSDLADRRNGARAAEREWRKQDPSLTREQIKAKRDAWMQDNFTETEMRIMEAGISNAGFHYLGSGKFMAQLGAGFADVLAPPAESE